MVKRFTAWTSLFGAILGDFGAHFGICSTNSWCFSNFPHRILYMWFLNHSDTFVSLHQKLFFTSYPLLERRLLQGIFWYIFWVHFLFLEICLFSYNTHTNTDKQRECSNQKKNQVIIMYCINTTCPLGHYHNGFMATVAIRQTAHGCVKVHQLP